MERPILFSGAMVRGTVRGIKKVTRRTRGLDYFNLSPDHWKIISDEQNVNGKRAYILENQMPEAPVKRQTALALCPYGQVGDLLWVRETCKILGFWHNKKFRIHHSKRAAYQNEHQEFWAADEYGDLTVKAGENPEKWTALDGWQTRPSIHMPRWASRILLEITDIRLERLRD